ncbi:MAG: TonB-like [Prolixibacteraceae bacterium]|nr:MAG: TonB-like [Prolixibacteraceae bacterium]
MDYIREHKRGIIGTAIFHIVVLLLLILLGFFTPLPLPGEEGILVNFGTSENGFGDIEPSPAQSEPAPVQPVQQEEEEVPPPPAVTSPPKPAVAKEVAMTQDYEQSAAIDAAENKKRQEEKKRQDLLEEQRIAQAREAERIKNAEAEKIRKAEAEKKAKEEADRKAKEEQQRRINEINSRAQGAFASTGDGTGGKGTGDGKSQGQTFPGGNQGVPTGDPNSNNYGQGSSGSGSQGSGPSFSLSGRSSLRLEIPDFPVKEEGRVVVEVFVDKLGNVTSARAGVQGTDLQNSSIWEAARQAALKSKFNNDPNAQASQKGTITYVFRPN